MMNLAARPTGGRRRPGGGGRKQGRNDNGSGGFWGQVDRILHVGDIIPQWAKMFGFGGGGGGGGGGGEEEEEGGT